MVQKDTYAYKKVLITQNALRRIQGSETVCLEMARFFRSIGAEVKVYTWQLGDPMMSLFKNAGIEVTTDEEDEFFDDCDFVWVHHQVIPQRLLRRISRNCNASNNPIFVFFHMSYMENLFLEQPYIYKLEEKIASKILFVSEEVRDTMKELHCFGDLTCPSEIFPNPAPASFMKSKVIPQNDLKKALIVSNHIPEEVIEAQKLLLRKFIEVESIGESGDSYTQVTPDLLSNYDVVITLGKTVQYCLIEGIPVYVYDKFGGPGYLNEQNFRMAAYHNFSGRGFESKSAETIAKEIVDGYQSALKFVGNHQDQYQKTYLLPEAMKTVLQGLEVQKYHFDNGYSRYINVGERVMQDKIRLDWECIDLRNAYDTERGRMQEAMMSLDMLSAQNADLQLHLSNALQFRGSRYVKKILKKPASAVRKLKNLDISPLTKKQSRIKIAKKHDWHEYKCSDDQLFLIRDSFTRPTPEDISILTRVRDEELLLPDTLRYLSETSPYIFVYDDDSRDETFELLCKNPNVKLIITNLRWRPERTAEETRSRGVLLDEAKQYSDSEWFWYTDADERIYDKGIKQFLNHLPKSVDGVRMRLFDAYMTPDDCEDYAKGQSLLDFRTYFGPEYRDILTFFRNDADIIYAGLDAREPVGAKKVIDYFKCQHYGKSLSIQQWEDTCEYYMNNFEEPYKTKWKNRLGKAIHKESDWGDKLYKWGDELFKYEKRLTH